MKTQQANIENQSNFGDNEVIQYGADLEDLAGIMNILSVMYSDEAAAVIREYTTNALDSHVAAGTDRPVEIQTPNRLKPFFSVQDYGVGLDLEELRTIYTRYSKSTKRNNDQETGNLGIGAKSGIAYAGQYTVATVKNGIKIIAIVTRNDEGIPEMRIGSTSKTDEHNGVKITIPVNTNFDTFNHKIRAYHQFLKPGLLLVDGQDADRSGFVYVGPNTAIVDHLTDDYIVMGSVAYPVNRRLYPRLFTKAVVTFVNMGEVQYTPNREELNYTLRTKNTLDKYREEFIENARLYMSAAVQQAPSIREAYNMQRDLLYGTNLDKTPFMYKGKQLPDNIGPNRFNMVLPGSRYRWNYSYDQYCKKISSFNSETIKSNVVYVKNWSNARLTRIQSDKIDRYCQENNIIVNNEAIFVGQDEHGMLDDCPTVLDWEIIRKIRLAPRPTGRKAKEYYGVSEGGDYAKFVPDNNLIIYYGDRDIYSSNRRYPSYRSDLKDWNIAGQQFVFVTELGKAKFLKDHPNALHASMFHKNIIENYLKNLSDKDRMILEASGGVDEGSYMIVDQLKDPELKLAAARSQGQVGEGEAEVMLEYKKFKRAWNRVSYAYQQKMIETYGDLPELGTLGQKMIERYPLLYCINIYNRTHERMQALTDYLNWVYETKGDK
jgi:hypothetical protein